MKFLLLLFFCINNHSTPRVEICHRVDRSLHTSKRFRRRLSSTLKKSFYYYFTEFNSVVNIFVPFLFQQVEYTPKPALEAGDTYGMSLLSPMNRDLFVRTMACIRAEILKRELPDSPKWKSKKDGLDVILSDF